MEAMPEYQFLHAHEGMLKGDLCQLTDLDGSMALGVVAAVVHAHALQQGGHGSCTDDVLQGLRIRTPGNCCRVQAARAVCMFPSGRGRIRVIWDDREGHFVTIWLASGCCMCRQFISMQ